MRAAGRVTVFAAMLAGAALLSSAVAAAPDAGAGAGAPEPAAADPDAPTVTARVDKSEAHVGDAITLAITAISRRGVPVNLPNTLDLGPFSVLDRKEAERDLGDGRVRR
ncbi:MAG TPA: hypothetical protein VNO55_20540, partial [Polyangia bacterium]|nr:hypothetical protein [Polyangia bacterium]